MTIFAGIAVMPWITTRDTVMERDELLKHLEMIKSNRRDDGQLTPPLQRGPLQPEQMKTRPIKAQFFPGARPVIKRRKGRSVTTRSF